MSDQDQRQNLISQSLKDSSEYASTERIKEILGIPEWVSNDIVEKAAADMFQRLLDEDKKFTLEMANHVWEKVKGYPIPECYSEKDRLEIFERYYHRAVSQSQGE